MKRLKIFIEIKISYLLLRENFMNNNLIAVDNRHYGIDILRQLSMFMVVLLHVLGHGWILANNPETTFTGGVILFIYVASYCAINVFALISGYVGVNAKHKTRNIVNLALQVMFYCVIFTVLFIVKSLMTGYKFGVRETLQYLLPFGFYNSPFGNYWYFAGYLCLYPLMPFLNKILEFPKQYLKKCMLFVFVVFMCTYQITRHHVNSVSLNGGYSVLWLAILYLVGGYFAKYKTFENIKGWVCAVGFLACVSLTFGNMLIADKITATFKCSTYSSFLFSYTSPTTFLSAVFLLGLFTKVKVKNEKVKWTLKKIHPAAFGVYLIHTHIFVWPYLRVGIVPVIRYPLWKLLPAVFVITSVIYLVCLLVDLCRIKMFKILHVNNIGVALEGKIEKLFAEKEESKPEEQKTEELVVEEQKTETVEKIETENVKTKKTSKKKNS